MNVVYVYRRGQSDELRYSLRSLANVPHDRVVVVGDAPPFPYRNITVVGSAHQGPNPQTIIRNHLIRLVQSATLDNDSHFYLFNDDFFVLDPVDSIPLYHRGPVAELDGQVDRAGLPVAGDWIDTERQTAAWLTERGVDPDPLSYALHVPMPMNVARCSWFALLPDGLRPRTFYGNYAAQGDGFYMEDVKIRRTDEHPSGLTPYVSTYEKTWKHGVIGEHIRDAFPNPSEYEAP